MIEVVVNRGVGRGEFLQIRHASEPGHCPFSSSEGLVRGLAEIVEIASRHVAVRVADLVHRGAVGAELVRHDFARRAIVFQGFFRNFKAMNLSCFLVA